MVLVFPAPNHGLLKTRKQMRPNIDIFQSTQPQAHIATYVIKYISILQCTAALVSYKRGKWRKNIAGAVLLERAREGNEWT